MKKITNGIKKNKNGKIKEMNEYMEKMINDLMKREKNVDKWRKWQTELRKIRLKR